MSEVTLKSLQQMKEDYEKAANENAKRVMTVYVREFMQDNPEIKAIGWTQYTPSFNDGDPCVFRFYGTYFSMEEPEGYKDEYYKNANPDDWHYYYSSKAPQDVAEKVRDFSKSLGNAEDLMEKAFGDSSQVIVTQEKFYISEYYDY